MSTGENMSDQFRASLHRLDIDMNIGIKYCGDIDFYREVLNIAYQVYLERYPQLNRYFEYKDYKNYTILVHSIKSGAANIGALKLSNMAKVLEDAGKTMDCEYIEANHQEFYVYYHHLMEGVANLLNLREEENSVKDNAPAQDINQDMWRETLERIKYYLEELELDMAEELVDQLLGCKKTDGEKDLLKSISKSLGSFDVENAKEKVNMLMAK